MMANAFIAALLILFVSVTSWDPVKVAKSAILPMPTADNLQAPVLPIEADKLQYHGTTTLSFLHKDCVIVCVDSKASVGNYVGSRTVKKVFPVSKSVVATMAGGAADCAYWIRRVAAAIRSIEYKYAASLNARAIARTLASSLREYKGMGMLCILRERKFRSSCSPLCLFLQ